MARPSLGKTRFMVSLPPRLLEALDARAAAQSRTRADVIQAAVEAMLGSEVAAGAPVPTPKSGGAKKRSKPQRGSSLPWTGSNRRG